MAGGFGKTIGIIFAVGFGLLLMAGSFGLTFWNEGRSMKRATDLAEGLKSTATVDAAVPDAANEGKLVHVSGQTATESTLTDEQFGVSVPQALKLQRVVEMYQWEEERKSRKGSDRYTYRKLWKDAVINSSSFRQSGHDNPKEKPFDSVFLAADDIIVGGFALAPEIVAQIENFEQIPMTEEILAQASPDVKGKGKIADGRIYYGNDPSNPAIGDVRVTFQVARPGDATVVARQAGLFLEPLETKSGGTLGFFQPGHLTAKAVFDKETSKNTVMTWLLRGAALLTMWIGVLCGIFSLRNNKGSNKGNVAVFFISILMAGALTVVSVAVSWLVYRPAVGAALLAGGLALMFLFYRMLKGRKQRSVVSPQTPLPPPPMAPPPPPPPVPSA